MPKPKQTMKPVKLPLAKKKSSRDIIRRLQQRYKKAKKRNFGKGLSLSTFYQRYYSVKEFDELHADVGIEEVYNEEDDDEEEYDEETYLIGKARALLSGPLEPLNRPNDTNWRNIVPILDDIFGELEPEVKDELVRQLCIQLDIDVDYDKNILILKRFFADIDRDGECINDNMSRHTFMFCHLFIGESC
jgi:hypothetical protein